MHFQNRLRSMAGFAFVVRQFLAMGKAAMANARCRLQIAEPVWVSPSQEKPA